MNATLDNEKTKKFIAGLIKSGHHSVIEHHNITVRIITDRGVTHEIVRHRLASYSQESTRYCNYSQDKFGNEITVILPVWFYECEDGGSLDTLRRTVLLDDKEQNQIARFENWRCGCEHDEKTYFIALQLGNTAQEGRDNLPNSLKTEIVMTCNLREWRHFFTLRASPKAHPQMKALAEDMLKGFRTAIPVIFDDIHPEVGI